MILSCMYSNIYIPYYHIRILIYTSLRTHTYKNGRLSARAPKSPFARYSYASPRKRCVCVCVCCVYVCCCASPRKRCVCVFLCFCVCVSVCVTLKPARSSCASPRKGVFVCLCACVSVCLYVSVYNLTTCEILLPKEEGAYMCVLTYLYTCIHIHIVVIWGGQTFTSRIQLVIQTSQTHTSCT